MGAAGPHDDQWGMAGSPDNREFSARAVLALMQTPAARQFHKEFWRSVSHSFVCHCMVEGSFHQMLAHQALEAELGRSWVWQDDDD